MQPIGLMLYDAVCYKNATVLANSMHAHGAHDLLQEPSMQFGAGWQHARDGANTAQAQPQAPPAETSTRSAHNTEANHRDQNTSSSSRKHHPPERTRPARKKNNRFVCNGSKIQNPKYTKQVCAATSTERAPAILKPISA